MANSEKIEEIKQSIADWESKRDSGMNPAIVEEILTKLNAELQELQG
ncbi:hypothetical protein [Rothia sp. ZJ1223]|nr:hypothetical protein [Rothia sp. ZJ1223]MBM7051960.1 hypothetical protein [Rothia sp. ZJ1223]